MRPVKEISKSDGAEFVTSRIVMEPFNYTDREISHTIFISNMIFCDTFTIDCVTGNENIIMENCTFNTDVKLQNLTNAKIIIRNCTFNSSLYVDNIQTENLELFGTTHYHDIVITGIRADLYFTDDVKMTGNHLLLLNDSYIKYCLKH